MSATVQSTHPLLNRKVPLDETSPGEAPMLQALQGNILRGHGRDHGVHVFFRFRHPGEPARRLLRELERRFVTSAYTQFREAVRFRKLHVTGGLFGNLFLTARGLEQLELGLDVKKVFFEADDLPDPHRIGSCFADGLQPHAEKDFGDPAPGTWDRGFRGEIHGMLLLADDDEHALMRVTQRVLDLLDPACEVHAVEMGHVIRNAAGDGIEHFGFVDGRSQPLYLAGDFTPQRTADAGGELVNRWDPFEPLGRVLVPDPLMNQAADCFGSFLVFRKLEQDVRGFRRGLGTLATDLGLSGPDATRHAGALVVGRFEDGTPIEMQKQDGWLPAIPNNFNYDTDIHGSRCPLHAHIRKVNPRGQAIRSGEGADAERIRRITRRSMTYGEHVPVTRPIDELPDAGVGVLFMCFQASIRRQFAFMQQKWCNQTWFPRAHVGADALVGQSTLDEAHTHAWPTTYNMPARKTAGFAPFVRMKGGEYFYAPSLPFFRSL